MAGAQSERSGGVLPRAKAAIREWLMDHSLLARRILWQRGNRPSQFVLSYLGGLEGIEIGASAHNDYRLNAINVDRFGEEDTIYREEEWRLAGRRRGVDVVAPGDELPFKDDAVDFVFASHVLEHFVDPIGALKEWLRVARNYVVLVIPHRDRTFDRNRELTPMDELLRRHEQQLNDPRDLHWSVWTLESFLELCVRVGFTVVDALDPDDKVGNGFVLVLDAASEAAAEGSRSDECPLRSSTSMDLPRRVAWNTVAQVAARILTLALSVVTTVVLTRHLGVSGYGIYVTVSLYVPFFALFFDAGITTFVVRSLSTGRAPRDLFRESLGLRLALALPVTALAFALAVLLYGGGDDATTRNAIAIGLPIILFATAASATTALFQVRLRMDRAALSEIVGQLVATSLIVLFVSIGLSIYAVVAAAVAGTFVNMALLLFLAARIGPVRPLLVPRRWVVLLRKALPLGLALMVATVYFRADAVLLSILKGPEAVGIYGVAYRLLEAMIAFPGFFYISIFPLLSQAAAGHDLERLRDLTQRAFDVLVVAAVPVVFGTVALAPQIVEALAGDGFEEAVTPLRVVIVGAGLMFVNGLFSYVLIVLDRQVTLLWIGLMTLAFNVVLNLALIPRYSYNAAATVATGSEALMLGALFVLVVRSARFMPALRVAGKAALAGAVMIACLAFTPQNLAVLVAVGSFAYGAALLLLGTHRSLRLRDLLGAKR